MESRVKVKMENRKVMDMNLETNMGQGGTGIGFDMALHRV